MNIQFSTGYMILPGYGKVKMFGYRKSNGNLIASIPGRMIEIDPSQITELNGVPYSPAPTLDELYDDLNGLIFNVTPTGPYLELALASFTDFPYPLNGHTIYTPDDLTNWNAAWGSSYTDCVVDNTGKTIRFYGYVGSVITTRGIERLIGVTDTGTLSNIASDCFIGCYNLINFSVSGQFDQSIIGETTGDDGIFGDVIGNTMAITIPQGLMESNGPVSPDGDIEFLISNNTVTVNTF